MISEKRWDGARLLEPENRMNDSSREPMGWSWVLDEHPRLFLANTFLVVPRLNSNIQITTLGAELEGDHRWNPKWKSSAVKVPL
jgi:hypothetical protein